ncbi:5'-AMP-activated protein kinase catalytic subunit alpha-2 [Reticulomyxa filosa]|uniref:non-specific serine/threonine protein kinase n=1 Tax=Reticulomyxa filosa TaxID=46433 RepID=X6L9M8_RETFI|nr:5'-AMP-activated protein kinase catalytic subunit alpha-2 [Reticulomyxa filosa]|eukprot:ETN98065.1 5'-AMP-activated protein kinase catalytic subunit alpha-2 [Reticulomyxa filosa]
MFVFLLYAKKSGFFLTDRKKNNKTGQNSKLNVDVSRIYFQQLINGAQFMHKHKICHRDLKVDVQKLAVNANRVLKISDFGLLVLYSREGEADIWSCGVILYTLLPGCFVLFVVSVFLIQPFFKKKLDLPFDERTLHCYFKKFAPQIFGIQVRLRTVLLVCFVCIPTIWNKKNKRINKKFVVYILLQKDLLN